MELLHFLNAYSLYLMGYTHRSGFDNEMSSTIVPSVAEGYDHVLFYQCPRNVRDRRYCGIRRIRGACGVSEGIGASGRR